MSTPLPLSGVRLCPYVVIPSEAVAWPTRDLLFAFAVPPAPVDAQNSSLNATSSQKPQNRAFFVSIRSKNSSNTRMFHNAVAAHFFSVHMPVIPSEAALWLTRGLLLPVVPRLR
jgi:hypothetical protein